MERAREERRRKMEEEKMAKKRREMANEAAGKNIDVEFDMLLEKYKGQIPPPKPHVSTGSMKISVCVRKRPIFTKEQQAGEIDCVSVSNPKIVVHECKYKVDGISKYIDNSEFVFDNSFACHETNDDLYKAAIQPNIHFPFNRGIVTCFAYGQTGSGKTFTMKGSNEAAIRDLFTLARTEYKDRKPQFHMSFFEIYGGKLFDLLNGRGKLTLLEDGNNKIQVQGLVERQVMTAEEMNTMIEYAHNERTTHATVANDTSSRSHAICMIQIKDGQGKTMGKLLLVDLAGSERAQDT